ncbi:hypothetical protein OC835_004687 [Tilletia horrida]|nr:hypothetical protein OC835_004687 [Tilletia horrida]
MPFNITISDDPYDSEEDGYAHDDYEDDGYDDDCYDEYGEEDDADNESVYSQNPGTEVDSGSEGSGEPAGDENGPLSPLAAVLAAAPSHRTNYSFSGAADFLPAAPGLVIEGVGLVPLPVVDKKMADSIAAVCEQSPYGRGFDTIVDQNVRNSWQLGPEKVKLEHPKWQAGIEQAAKLIATELGVPDAPLSVHLYKLLFYQEGGHFAKHRDTEKHDRMFATMVVQLPSRHEGGHLLVYQPDDPTPVTHDFGDSAGMKALECHYAVHYADAEHAVTPITSGYRTALVYSICWPKDSTTPIPNSDINSTTTQEAAACLQALSRAGHQFHYFLDHAYTEKSLKDIGAGALKGLDRNRLATLRAANRTLAEEEQFVFQFGLATKYAFHQAYCGNSYHHASYEEEENYSGIPNEQVALLIPLEGGAVSTSASPDLHDAIILNPDRKSKGQLWHGRRTTVYEGNLGNEGPTKETTHKFILMGAPRSLGVLGQFGESFAFKEMMKISPSVAQLELFIKNMRGRCKPDDDFKTQRFDVGGKLFDLVVGNEAYHCLAASCVRMYPSAIDLMVDQVMALITTPSIWAQDSVRQEVAQLFEKDECSTTRVAIQCLRKKVQASQWTVFKGILERSQDDPLPVRQDDDIADPWSRRKTYTALNLDDFWTIAILLPDKKLCARAVKRHVKVPAASLNASTDVLVALKAKYPEQFRQRQTELQPLFQARLGWLQAQRSSLDAETRRENGWRMPRAKLHFPKHVEFFHGPEQIWYMTDFKGMRDARSYADSFRHGAYREACTFTIEACRRDGEACVKITKTADYFAQCARQSAELKPEIARLQALLPTSAPRRSAGDAGLPADERPARRVRS